MGTKMRNITLHLFALIYWQNSCQTLYNSIQFKYIVSKQLINNLSFVTARICCTKMNTFIMISYWANNDIILFGQLFNDTFKYEEFVFYYGCSRLWSHFRGATVPSWSFESFANHLFRISESERVSVNEASLRHYYFIHTEKFSNLHSTFLNWNLCISHLLGWLKTRKVADSLNIMMIFIGNATNA